MLAGPLGTPTSNLVGGEMRVGRRPKNRMNIEPPLLLSMSMIVLFHVQESASMRKDAKARQRQPY